MLLLKVGVSLSKKIKNKKTPHWDRRNKLFALLQEILGSSSLFSKCDCGM